MDPRQRAPQLGCALSPLAAAVSSSRMSRNTRLASRSGSLSISKSQIRKLDHPPRRGLCPLCGRAPGCEQFSRPSIRRSVPANTCSDARAKIRHPRRPPGGRDQMLGRACQGGWSDDIANRVPQRDRERAAAPSPAPCRVLSREPLRDCEPRGNRCRSLVASALVKRFVREVAQPLGGQGL